MSVPTSSLIGANLGADDSTALFTVGTRVNATDGGLYEYVCCSGTFTTGYFVFVTTSGSAWALTTALLTANAQGYDIGVVQKTISAGNYGWVAKQGRNLYLLATGTCTGASEVGLAFASTGRIINQPVMGVGATALGIFVTTSASTATASVCVGMLVFPRGVIHN